MILLGPQDQTGWFGRDGPGETVRGSLYKAIVYYEELLSASFPFSLYKQVFVSKLPEKYKSYR